MNSVALMGRLTKDPEFSQEPGRTPVCHFSLAVDRPKRDGNDAGADFIRITVFGKTAESSYRYLGKGLRTLVTGRIQTGNYKNKNGETVYTTDIIADRVEFIDFKNGSNSGNGTDGAPGYYNNAQTQGFGNQEMMPQNNAQYAAQPQNNVPQPPPQQMSQFDMPVQGYQEAGDDIDW